MYLQDVIAMVMQINVQSKVVNLKMKHDVNVNIIQSVEIVKYVIQHLTMHRGNQLELLMHIHAKVDSDLSLCLLIQLYDCIHLACVCNGFAKNCTFSRELFDRTGHGSVCIDCAGNRGGPNCERCKVGFYRLPDQEGECLPCNCDPVGKIA